MLSPDELYCNPVPFVDAAHAARLQTHISYLYRNFNRSSIAVAEAMTAVRAVFLRAMECALHAADVRDIMGLMTTGGAFDIPRDAQASPSPDDTRIALMIGRPVCRQNERGEWEMALEKRYVVALRVVDRATVHMTRVLPAFRRSTHFKALGRPLSRRVAEEGRATNGRAGCGAVVEAGREAVDNAVALTRAQVDRLVEEATTKFESLLRTMSSSLGTTSLPTAAFELEVKRIHSRSDAPSLPAPCGRCDTEFVEKATASAKRALGEEPRPPRPGPTGP